MVRCENELDIFESAQVRLHTGMKNRHVGLKAMRGDVKNLQRRFKQLDRCLREYYTKDRHTLELVRKNL